MVGVLVSRHSVCCNSGDGRGGLTHWEGGACPGSGWRLLSRDKEKGEQGGGIRGGDVG
jgi:hypothetical protein